MTLTGASNKNASSVAQIIPGRLYFTSVPGIVPKNDAKSLYIDIDDQMHYDAFYDDFGPLNLAVLYRFCQFLNELLQSTARSQKRVFLCTNMCPQKRVNAVYLITSYMIIYHNLSAEQAYLRLQSAEPPNFIGFRDAALGPPSYLLHVQHVTKAIEKAHKFNWLDFHTFDADEYEFFERVENGDLNWVVPGKILSFCGPHDRSYVENGYPYHSPEVYFDYFRAHNVTAIIRLNKKIYDAKRFSDAGFLHHDLFFIDGSTPSDEIVLKFIDAVDSAKGAVAVHCKAGLGRTGTLIACWMMKHFRITAPQCMGWLRVCRPGSVIGPQQQFLIDKQQWCWRLGRTENATSKFAESKTESGSEAQRTIAKLTNGGERQQKAAKCEEVAETNGVTSSKEEKAIRGGALCSAKEAMEEETAVNAAGQSQGDRLCEIKARMQLRQHSNRLRTSGGPPTSREVAATPFVFPHSSQQFVSPSNTHFSSATTPIKQLKLSSTAACGSPNPGVITAMTPMTTRKRAEDALLANRSAVDTMHTAKRNLLNKIPKVSVSASPASPSSRVQLHRKHFSSSSSRLKPYMPNNDVKMSTGAIPDAAQRFLASPQMPLSATQSYGKTLQKQFAAIERHKKDVVNNNSSSNCPSSPLPSNFQSPVDGPLAHNTNCKYELRPRDSLHIPSRFATDLQTPGTGMGPSPFALARNHKTTKSASSFFPSSRI